MSTVAVATPARPRHFKSKFEKTDDRLRVTWRKTSWVLVAFLSLWLTAWTVGCVFLVNAAIQERTLHIVLVCIPFLASWLFVFAMIFLSVTYREDLALDGEGAEVARRVLSWNRRRLIPLHEIFGFETCEKVVDRKDGRLEYGVQMRTLGKPVEFGYGMPDGERQWLIWRFQEHLESLHQTARYQVPGSALIPAAVSEGNAVSSVEILTVTSERPTSPSDCRWRRVDERDAIAFVQRGQWQPGAVSMLLLLNAFWNGIVSLFIRQLVIGQAGDFGGFGWWGLFVFLIPFETIGLGMLFVLLLALFEPARTTAWEFADRCVRYRVQWFGIGPIRRYQIDWIDRLELREVDARATRRLGSWLDFSPHELALVDSTNTDVAVIDNLTEGEARWIADAIQREFGNWFR